VKGFNLELKNSGNGMTEGFHGEILIAATPEYLLWSSMAETITPTEG
jgi:hypothetical protein